MDILEIEEVGKKMMQVTDEMMQPLFEKIHILDAQNKKLMGLLRANGIDFSHLLSVEDALLEKSKSVDSSPVVGAETKEEVFAELVKDLVRKEDRMKYPNSVFWFNKAGQFMFEYDEKNEYFWCSYNLVWSVFESKFGMKYNEIQIFTKGLVEKHFNCKVIATTYYLVTTMLLVEKHFNCKVMEIKGVESDTFRKVKKYFNWKK